MLSKITLSALAFVVAAPAFAMGSGTQLERSIGVEAGTYTLAEQALLSQAINDNDYRLINFITGGNDDATASRGPVGSPFVPSEGPVRTPQRASEQ